MVPPRWPDEQGRSLPTYPCPRCGREVAVRFRGFRVENLKHVGWQAYRGDLRELVWARPRDHPDAAAGWQRNVRAGAGGGAVAG
jgi:hypothetical protein